mmetsp:Transcript_120853/g.225999  ORF Transcript_120853/g.225999 Transcript_120853/m.225999 type:complete len:706 (-) Transcript_120853:50-2167(-)
MLCTAASGHGPRFSRSLFRSLSVHDFLMWLVLIAVICYPAAASPGDCPLRVGEMLKSETARFMRMSLASGKALPFDAGKYVMCMSGEQTRYFLVSMTGTSKVMLQKDGKPMSLPMKVGFCVPDVCDHDGMIALVNSSAVAAYLPELNPGVIAVTDIIPKSPELDRLTAEDTSGIIVLTILGIFVLLVFVSTLLSIGSELRRAPVSQLPTNTVGGAEQLLDMEAAPELRTHRHFCARLAASPLLQAFSLVGETGTLRKLVESPPYKPTDSLNGLRVLSMLWIILGHSYLMPEGISGYENTEVIVENPLNPDVAERNVIFGFVVSAQSAVDTFFFLSGFLLSFLTLKELRSRNGRLDVLAAVLLRYVRLTPSLALAMIVYYKIWPFLGYGPFLPKYQASILERCDNSWWSELTYTMNFIPFDSDKVCMGWTWYLGDDMIFFLVAILILPLYYRRKWLGWISVLLITFASFAVTGWLVFKYGLSVYAFDDHYARYSYYAYSKPYSRIPAYLVGIVAAWVLEELERRGITRSTRPHSALAKVVASVCSLCAFGMLIFLTFVPMTDYGKRKDSWGNWSSLLYIDFSRPLWSICFAVITLLCYYDYLPIVNSFLSHRFWTPLARLTYGAYLTHPMVIKLAAGTSTQFYSFSGLDLFYRFTGNCIMAFSGAVLLWALVERPAMTLTSAALKKPRAGHEAEKPRGEEHARSTS